MPQDRRATDEPNWNSFSPITPDDHAGYIWIATLLSMTISLLVAATRIWIKKDAFGLDDTLFVAAIVSLCSILQALPLVADLEEGYHDSSCHLCCCRVEEWLGNQPSLSSSNR
jgi:hypothetical protein